MLCSVLCIIHKENKILLASFSNVQNNIIQQLCVSFLQKYQFCNFSLIFRCSYLKYTIHLTFQRRISFKDSCPVGILTILMIWYQMPRMKHVQFLFFIKNCIVSDYSLIEHNSLNIGILIILNLSLHRSLFFRSHYFLIRYIVNKWIVLFLKTNFG